MGIRAKELSPAGVRVFNYILDGRLDARACLGKAAGSKPSALVVRKTRYVELYFTRRSLDTRPRPHAPRADCSSEWLKDRRQARHVTKQSLLGENYFSIFRIILVGVDSTLVVFRRLSSNSFEPVSFMQVVLTQALCSKYGLFLKQSLQNLKPQDFRV